MRFFSITTCIRSTTTRNPPTMKGRATQSRAGSALTPSSSVRQRFLFTHATPTARCAWLRSFETPDATPTTFRFRCWPSESNVTGVVDYKTGRGFAQKSELSAEGAEYESQGQAPKARNMKARASAEGAEYESQGQAPKARNMKARASAEGAEYESQGQ